MVSDLAYFVQIPPGDAGGVLLLSSYWGLTKSVKALADELADEGYTVLVPDLNYGQLPESEPEALAQLRASDPDRLATLVLTSAGLLVEKSPRPQISIVGFGMGGSLGLWASVRLHSIVEKAVTFYGSQQIDFAGSNARYLVHWAANDEHVSDDEVVFMEATMGLEDLDVESHVYPGTAHGFAEPEGASFDAQSFEVAWGRTIEFLGEKA
jgi:carboxymethylenebutenolidase